MRANSKGKVGNSGNSSTGNNKEHSGMMNNSTHSHSGEGSRTSKDRKMMKSKKS